jgi:hypothetical protein
MSPSAFFLSTVLLLATNSEPHSFTIIDFWQRKCEEGDKAACSKLETNKQNELKLENLNSLASKFQESIKSKDFLLDKKPNLGKAYPLVIKNYLESFKTQQFKNLGEFVIDYCAKHFHNYWLNKKYWWPTNSEDKPDWGTIYVYIVDHYHGLCLRQPF